MQRLNDSVAHFQRLDEISRQKTWIHRLHPLTKLLATLLVLLSAASFSRDEVSGLLPLLLYPALVFPLADVPAWPLLKRLLLIEPLIIGVGLLNPLLDRSPVVVGSLVIAHGWLTLSAIILKSTLTVLAALLLIATTGIDQLAGAMRLIRIPRIFTTVIVLIYRYLAVLAGETGRTLLAYALRAPRHPGVRFKAWGSLAGQVLLRSLERAERVHQAMQLRGFNGDFPLAAALRPTWRDAAWLAAWLGFCLLARSADLPAALGNLITGAIT